MSDFDYVLATLKAARFTDPQIARDTGLPVKWITRVRTGEIKNPGAERVSVLASYFRLRDEHLVEMARLRERSAA